MSLSVDPDRFYASYLAMTSAKMTDEQRAEIWERGREHFPDLAKILMEKYNSYAETKDAHQLDRMSGAVFLFLVAVNSMTEEPIIPHDPLPTIFGRIGKTLPAFGYLKKLS